MQSNLMVVDQLNEERFTEERACSKFWMWREQARAMKAMKMIGLAMLI